VAADGLSPRARIVAWCVVARGGVLWLMAVWSGGAVQMEMARLFGGGGGVELVGGRQRLPDLDLGPLGPIWVCAGCPKHSGDTTRGGGGASAGMGGGGAASRPTAAGQRLCEPVWALPGQYMHGVSLLPSPVGYREGGGGSSLLRGCSVATPTLMSPFLPLGLTVVTTVRR
jgi:hypothetical protein